MKKFLSTTIIVFTAIVLCGCVPLDWDNIPTNQDGDTKWESDDERPIKDTLDTVPSEYTDTIADYKKVVKLRLSDTFEDDYNSGIFVSLNENLETDLNKTKENTSEPTASLKNKWNNMVADMLDGIKDPSIKSFGYILKDLDEDNSPELIWVSSDYNVIFAVFTIYDGKAKLLDAYWSRYKTVVLDTGDLYTLSHSSADTFSYSVAKLDKNKDLKVTKYFGSDQGKYFESTDSATVTIDESKFNQMLSEYPFEFSSTWEDNQIYVLND